jgi:hypothetical protein
VYAQYKYNVPSSYTILGALYIWGPTPLEGNPFDRVFGSTIGLLFCKWVNNWASQCKAI